VSRLIKIVRLNDLNERKLTGSLADVFGNEERGENERRGESKGIEILRPHLISIKASPDGEIVIAPAHRAIIADYTSARRGPQALNGVLIHDGACDIRRRFRVNISRATGSGMGRAWNFFVSLFSVDFNERPRRGSELTGALKLSRESLGYPFARKVDSSKLSGECFSYYPLRAVHGSTRVYRINLIEITCLISR